MKAKEVFLARLTSDSVPLSGNVTGVTGLIGSSWIELITGLDGSIALISWSSVLFSSFNGSEAEGSSASFTLGSC